MGQANEFDAARIKSVALGEWPHSYSSCALELSPRRTVLVGKNGAGKSLLMDGLFRAARAAVSRLPRRTAANYPGSSHFVVQLPSDTRELSFKYRLTRLEMSEEEIVEAEGILRYDYSEECSLDGTSLWAVKNGTVNFPDGKNFPTPPGLGLLAFEVSERPSEAESLSRLFRGMHRVAPGFPRHAGKEFEIAQRRTNNDRPRSGAKHPNRVSHLSDALVSAFDSRREVFDEFAELMKRLGVSKATEVSALSGKGSGESEFAMVEFDGCNIGELSDGTLRVAEIVWRLISLRAGDLLLFEEPEVGIHPGLLRRLLEVVDAYTIDHQVVVSTHSLQVVNWAEPSEIRLVHTSRDRSYMLRTVANALSAKQLARLEPYLNDEGSLADFIYSGGADE